MIKLNVQFEKPFKPFGKAEVGSIINALSGELKPPDYVVNIKVVDKTRVQALNKRYGGKDEPTDVLSFNYAEDGTSAEKQADVVISYQHVASQAKEAKTSQSTELALLILHGVLHILGYDHQNRAQISSVNELQAKLMQKAGLDYRNFGWKN